MSWLPLVMMVWILGAPGTDAQDGRDAQDATATLPGSYTRQFENEWVRVVRVHYPPHATLPAHTHPTVSCAYVYLNDSGPVVFKHVGGDTGVVTRPPTRAGAFRLARGLEEIHEVENLSAQPSDFLRVELKTDPKEPRTLRGKFYRETPPPGANLEKVQFENVQVRITRLVIAAGQPVDVRTTPQEPALLIALTPGRIEGEPGASQAATSFTPGQELWIATAASRRLHNAGAAPLELLRFDFKTPPLAAR